MPNGCCDHFNELGPFCLLLSLYYLYLIRIISRGIYVFYIYVGFPCYHLFGNLEIWSQNLIMILYTDLLQNPWFGLFKYVDKVHNRSSIQKNNLLILCIYPLPRSFLTDSQLGHLWFQVSTVHTASCDFPAKLKLQRNTAPIFPGYRFTFWSTSSNFSSVQVY